MEPVPVFRATSSSQASLVQNWLEDSGIESTLLGGEMQSGAFDIVQSDPVVLVAAEDYERAMQTLEEYQTAVRSGKNLENMSEEEGLFGWPICPQCDELQEATCSECGQTSSEFTVDVVNETSKTRCLRCGKEAELTPSATCRFCQHDFLSEKNADETVSLDGTVSAANGIHVEANTGRVLFVLLAVVALAFIVTLAIVFR